MLVGGEMRSAPKVGCWDLEIGGTWRHCVGEEHERRHGRRERDEYKFTVTGPRNFLLDQCTRVLNSMVWL